MFFEPNETLIKNSSVQLQHDNGTPFFVFPQGFRVQTDKVGQAVWENLPNPGHEVIAQVQKQWLVSETYLKKFLFLLQQAKVLGNSIEKDNIPSQPIVSIQEKLVSVIVITYNGSDHLADCFLSLLNQSYSNLEIFAIDNGSSDDTVARINQDYPSVKTFVLNRNRHYSGGVNQGLIHAQGKYLCILNQDVELERECIHHLVQALEKEPRIGAVAPMMKFFHLRGFINGIGNQIRREGWGSDNFIGMVDVVQFSSLQEVPSACFGAVMVRREAVEDVGLLDEGYGSFYEDVDWSFRCWFKGWKIVPEVRAVVYHKFGASYPQGQKLRFALRNRFRLVLKLFQKRTALGYIKRYLKEDIKNLLSSFKKREFTRVPLLLRTYLSLCFQLPGIYRKRRQIMRGKIPHLREAHVL